MASRLVWLPSMTSLSGRPCHLSALRRSHVAAVRLRRSLNQNSTLQSAALCLDTPMCARTQITGPHDEYKLTKVNIRQVSDFT
jgi:hypothetical protein